MKTNISKKISVFLFPRTNQPIHWGLGIRPRGDLGISIRTLVRTVSSTDTEAVSVSLQEGHSGHFFIKTRNYQILLKLSA
jgi:hypothetical protein